jgi:hypothetical protein
VYHPIALFKATQGVLKPIAIKIESNNRKAKMFTPDDTVDDMWIKAKIIVNAAGESFASLIVNSQ